MAAFRRDIVRKVRQVGLLGTIAHAARRVARGVRPGASPRVDDFDAKYGTETAEIVSVGALDIPDELLDQSNRYEAIAPEGFAKIIGGLELPYERLTFIDIGCGKGRALLLASLFPFREIIGIEISAALVRAAADNIRKFHEPAQKCRAIRAEVLDGGAYEPPDQDCLLFLNNPFGHEVMERFVASVEKSLRMRPKKLYVVYLTPLQRHVWDRSPLFRPVRQTGQVAVYESV